MALQDYIANMEENLDSDENVVLVFDFDIAEDREKIIDFNTELQANPRTATIFISGPDSLALVKEHQNRDDSAGAYLIKPLSADIVDGVIADLDFASSDKDDGKMEFDDATVADLSFKNFDLSQHQDELNKSDETGGLELSDDDGDDEDNTLVKEIVNSHNESTSFYGLEENENIQDIFDSALGAEETTGSDEQTQSASLTSDSDDGGLSLNLNEDATVVAPLSLRPEGGEHSQTDPSVTEENVLGELEELGSLSLSDGEPLETNAGTGTMSLEEELSEDGDHDALDFTVGDLSVEDSSSDAEENLDSGGGLELGGLELPPDNREDQPLEAISPLDESEEAHTLASLQQEESDSDISFDISAPEPEPEIEFNEATVIAQGPITNELQDLEPSLEEETKVEESLLSFEEETAAIPSSPEISDDNLNVDMDSLVEQTTSGVAYSAEQLNEEAEITAVQNIPEQESNYTFKAIPESEALRYQATIKQLREEREGLLSQINKFKQDAAVQDQDLLGLRSELDEVKIENSIIKKRYHNELEDYAYRLKIAADKKSYAEEKLKYMEKEFRRLENRVRVDVNHTRQREKELEGQLELVKMDSESQVQTRDKKILELKRKIDQLEFNMENASIREQKSREDKVQLEDRLEKIMKTLRGSIEVLEEDISWTEKEK